MLHNLKIFCLLSPCAYHAPWDCASSIFPCSSLSSHLSLDYSPFLPVSPGLSSLHVCTAWKASWHQILWSWTQSTTGGFASLWPCPRSCPPADCRCNALSLPGSDGCSRPIMYNEIKDHGELIVLMFISPVPQELDQDQAYPKLSNFSSQFASSPCIGQK